MATDSPLAAAFVAAPDHWDRRGAGVRAIVIHHAEGGGTVSWLTRNDGNSCHYVVEYTGRIVQMVRESRAAGSMKPTLTRKGNDAPFEFLGERIVYGRAALDAAGISSDPNRYAIAIEVEGFAKDGPNSKQRESLKRLVADIRTRHPRAHVLGHRDQQDYKACPGKKIPWADYGGHGAPGGEVPLEFANAIPKKLTIPAETGIYRTDGSLIKTIHSKVVKVSPLGVYLNGTGYRVIDATDGDQVMVGMVKSKDVTFELIPEPAPPPPVVVNEAEIQARIEEAVAAAVSADRAKARVTWE